MPGPITRRALICIIKRGCRRRRSGRIRRNNIFYMRRSILVVLCLAVALCAGAQDDHDNMMKQLGIRALRPGPNGDDKAPNHANYDTALANPYPNLPDVLTLKNGNKVTTAAMWWDQRRPEIVEDFEREVY